MDYEIGYKITGCDSGSAFHEHIGMILTREGFEELCNKEGEGDLHLRLVRYYIGIALTVTGRYDKDFRSEYILAQGSGVRFNSWEEAKWYCDERNEAFYDVERNTSVYISRFEPRLVEVGPGE